MCGNIWEDLKKAGTAILGFFCCLLCTGPVCIIIGIALLASAGNDTRSSYIATYNDAIKAWQAPTGYNVWQNTTTARVSVVTGGMGPLTLSGGAVTDSPPVEASSGIQTYTQRWALLGTQSTTLGPATSVSNPSTTATTTQTMSLTIGAQQVWSASVPLVVPYTFAGCNSGDSSSTCTTKCSAAGAQYLPNQSPFTTCAAYLQFTGVCLVVTNTGSGTDPAYTGCAQADSRIRSAQKSVILASGTNDIGPYKYTVVAGLPPTTVSFSGSTYTVRSSLDPYVTAQRIGVIGSTSISFGLSTAAKIGAGIAMLVIGGLFICGIIGIIACVSWCCKKAVDVAKGPQEQVNSGQQPAIIIMQPSPQAVQPVGYPQQGYSVAPQPGYPAPGYAGGYPQQQQQPGYGYAPQPGMMQPGYAPQPGYSQQPGYAPQPGYPQQPGYAPQPGMMPPAYAPQAGAY